MCSRLLGRCVQALALPRRWASFSCWLRRVCYWGALSRFTAEEQNRNRRVCASYAVALLLAGSFLLFPANFQAPFLCLAAVTAALLYMRTGKLSLGIHVSLVSGSGGDPLWPSGSRGERFGWNCTILSGCRRMGGRSLRRALLRNRMACFDRSMETAACSGSSPAFWWRAWLRRLQ